MAMHPALQPLMLPRDALRPPSADGTRVGAVLSGLAHVGLVVALALGVQWRTESPEGVEAELWAAAPQMAAPPAAVTEQADAPAPPPPPAATLPPMVAPPPRPVEPDRDADIATERAERERKKAAQQAADDRTRERKELLQKQQAEQQDRDKKAQEQARQQQLKDDQNRKEQAGAAARERARQDQLRRMNAQLGGSGAPDSAGTASRDAGPSANYAGRIKARIRPQIVLIDAVAGNPQAEVELRVAPDGTILSRRLTQASGSAAWDEAVLRAIDRTAVLPRDTDGRVPPSIVIVFRPQD